MQDFLSTVILLFIVIDPVGLAPMIQGMLKKYSAAQQKAILMRELVFALSLLLLFFFSGKFLLGPAGAGTVHPEYFRGHPAVPRGAGHGLSRQGHALFRRTH